MTLTEFLLARITEDEARAASHHRLLCLRTACDAECCWGEATDEQIAAERVCTCGYPVRVLAECQAGRRIVELHREVSWGSSDGPRQGKGCAVCHDWRRYPDLGKAWVDPVDYPCATLRLLALPHADHKDYDESWRP